MMSNFVGGGYGWFVGPALFPFIIWVTFWKAWALWIAARKGEKWWFLALLIINTAGILEIVYLLAISKIKLGTIWDKSIGVFSAKPKDACCGEDCCAHKEEPPKNNQ